MHKQFIKTNLVRYHLTQTLKGATTSSKERRVGIVPLEVRDTIPYKHNGEDIVYSL